MEVIYRPLLPPTQYCPCDWRFTAAELNSLPHSQIPSPFFRSLFTPFSPLWVDTNPATTDNSRDVSTAPEYADINHRAIFERQKKLAARSWDSTALMTSLYIPRGRWLWTHQVPFEDRSEEIPITHNQNYTLSIRTSTIYQENITYIRKLWAKERQWDGFSREVMLHKTQLRPIQGALVPSLIGIHTNLDGVQMTYDIPHHSFWIQASPDMPDVLKRRCLEAYSQLHAQGVLHGNVELENILIGGDGRAKIINFDQSRSGIADPRVQLHQATLSDFKLEMREVHYKLDYMQARKKERMVWENRNNPQAIELAPGNKSKIHDRPPYTVSLEPPVDPAQWSLPELWTPKRFVVPGQSVQQFEYHLTQFLLRMDEEASEGMDPPKFKSRKRKRHGDDRGSTDEHPHKRVRFLALTRLDDGTTREMKSPPPPGVRRVVPRISRDDSRDRRHPFEPDEGLTTSSTPYSRSLPNSSPHLFPVFDHEEFISAWESARGIDLGNSGRPGTTGDEERLSERARGKRRQVDADESTLSQDGPRVKRLRRSETTILESFYSEDTGSSRAASISRTPLPRYTTRSSSTGMQASPRPVIGASRSLLNRSTRTKIRSTGTTELGSQRTDIGSMPSPPPSSSSSGGPSLGDSPTLATKSLSSLRGRVRGRTVEVTRSFAISDSVEQSNESSHTDSTEAPVATRTRLIPSISDRSNFVYSFQNQGPVTELTGRTREAMNELISATAVVNNSHNRFRGSQSTRDSFGPIIIFFDPSLAVSQPAPARTLAEQLPNTIRTVARTIARTFGLC